MKSSLLGVDGARVIYDGDCGFCQRFVAWTGHRDVVAFQFLSPGELARLGITREDCAHALQLAFADGAVLSGGAAVNALVARRVPALAWALSAVQSIAVLSHVQALAYRAVANNRSRLSALLGITACAIRPSAGASAPASQKGPSNS
jgi:predicted DCC family thiol-disulfide oxidoreductase YuxK